MIVTVTMNPAIDISATVDEVAPFRKLRCTDILRDPGGGGINVARVMRRFGADVTALYPAGGTIGKLLQQLVADEGIASLAIPIAEENREDFTAFERKSGHEFRFVLPGPEISEREWNACLDALREIKGEIRYVVLSGSLPPGVPDDFYVRAAKIAQIRNARVAVDTSGKPLQAVLEAGVHLVKPNRRELQEWLGKPLDDLAAQVDASRQLVEDGHADIVALTLGDAGGVLTTREGAWRAVAPPVKPVSTVGAGDSFLSAMILRLNAGDDLPAALRYGIAAGSAALLSPGTELCRPEDVERLVGEVKVTRL